MVEEFMAEGPASRSQQDNDASATPSSSAPQTLAVSCPDCDCEMEIDSRTGQVLSHSSKARGAKAGGKDFDTLLAGLDDANQRASALFDQGIEAQKDRGRLLDEKFRRALERAEHERAGESGAPKAPERPWDFE